LHNPRQSDDVKSMTLIDFYTLSRDVAGAISRLKEGIVSAESSEELELLTSRLKEACDVLSKATCKDAGRHEVRDGARLIEEGRRLVFVVKVRGVGEEFPRIHQF
jgi:hypothetical protein